MADVHVRGMLTTSQPANDFTIEMRSAAGGAGDYATAMPGLNGQFEFPNVKPGHFILAVKNQSGETIKEEHVWVNGGGGEVAIKLKDERTEAANVPGNGTVNVRRLNHKVPKAAQKAMFRYRNCRAKADDVCAVQSLDAAITLDPALVEAYVNRSALAARSSNWAQAIADIDQALRLDPMCVMAHANRAFVAVHQKDFNQAIASAKAALRTEPGNVNAQYLLALAQVNTGDFENGFRQLDKLADEYEPARRTLEQSAGQRKQIMAILARRKSEKTGSTESTTAPPKPPAAVSGPATAIGASFVQSERNPGLRRPAPSLVDQR